MRCKHTPGPWFIFGNGHCVGGPSSPDDPELPTNPDDLDEYEAPKTAGVALCGMTRRPVDENAANARLIAAAPDLLAACEAFDAIATYGASLPKGFAAARDLARAAIAKAKGGAQ